MAPVIMTTANAHHLLVGPKGRPNPRQRTTRKAHEETMDKRAVKATLATQPGMTHPLPCTSGADYGTNPSKRHDRRQSGGLLDEGRFTHQSETDGSVKVLPRFALRAGLDLEPHLWDGLQGGPGIRRLLRRRPTGKIPGYGAPGVTVCGQPKLAALEEGGARS